MSLECPQDVLNLAKKRYVESMYKVSDIEEKNVRYLSGKCQGILKKKGSVERQCSVTDIEGKKEIRATCLFWENSGTW